MNSLSKLFIIGNGFDLAHGIPSTFNHFKEYLRYNYSYDYSGYSVDLWLEPTTYPDGGEEYNIADCAKIIDFMIRSISDSKRDGENWSDFEIRMGEFDYSVLEEDILVQYDKEGDENYSSTREMYERAYKDLAGVMGKLPILFSEWINDLSIPNLCFSVPNLETYYFIKELIDAENDIFFTFNYTNTLEELYEAQEVLHIHGTQNSEIIVGHSAVREFGNMKYEQDEQMYSIHANLQKPTDRIIEENSEFFQSLEGKVDSIYSYGFSFSDVDLVYIRELLEHVDSSNIEWYLHCYDSEQRREEFKNIIKSCGFLGSFREFG